MTTAGQVAYEAYSARTGGASAVSGAPLPTWAGLLDQPTGELVRAAWEAAGAAVANAERLVIVD